MAEGRITVRPWMERIEGRNVRFTDGTEDKVDGIVLGTGYRLSLPWLDGELARQVELDASGMTLFAHSFHPALDGLAFVGLYDLVGPYLPVLELQARCIASCWGGPLDMPSRADMETGLAAARAARQGTPAVPMNAMALAFARLAGAEPCMEAHPDLRRALLFGPLSPVSFRIGGQDGLVDAADRTRAAAAAFGAIVEQSLTAEEDRLADLLFRQRTAA